MSHPMIWLRLKLRRLKFRALGLHPSPVRPLSDEERVAAEDFIAREERALREEA